MEKELKLFRAMCAMLLGHLTEENHATVQQFLDETAPMPEVPAEPDVIEELEKAEGDTDDVD